MHLVYAKKITLVVSLFVPATQLHASQAVQERRHQESIYCSALQCWSQKPCFQHPQHNAPSMLHDAQRLLPRGILYIIGAYAVPEHTHILDPHLPESYVFPTKSAQEVASHAGPYKKAFLIPEIAQEHYTTAALAGGGSVKKLKEGFNRHDNNSYTNKMTLDFKTHKLIILLTDAEKKLFTDRPKPEWGYVTCYETADNGFDVLSISKGKGQGLMHLSQVEEVSILEQAGFLPVFHEK